MQRTIDYHEVALVVANARALNAKKGRKLAYKEIQRLLRKEEVRLREQYPTTIAPGLHAQIDEIVEGYREQFRHGSSDIWIDAAAMEQLRQRVNVIFRDQEEAAGGIQHEAVQLPDVLVGHELTFTNAEFAKVTQNARKGRWGAERARTGYSKVFDDVLQAWDDAMTAYGFTAETGTDQYNSATRTYTLEGVKNGPNNWSPDWSYSATFDDAVIEIITPPTAAGALVRGEIAEAMDRYIFGVANKLGLEAGVDAGSGHINIDRVSGFETDGRDLATFLDRFYQDARWWKDRDPDSHNAPFPDENSRKAQAQKVIDDYKGRLGAGSEARSHDFIERMMDEVFDRALVENEDMKAHFQAVNLEHYEEELADRRRVEVRRVVAPENRAELLAQLRRLFGLMKQEM